MQGYFKWLLGVCFLLLFSCKERQQTTVIVPHDIASKSVSIFYAKGFSIENFGTYKIIEVTAPWPESKEVFRYLVIPKGASLPKDHNANTIVRTPISKLIVTSTTDIPMLEYLELEDKLIGFPNTDYISSEKTRKRIENGFVKELGAETAINTELVLDLAPDLVIGFSATGTITSLKQLQKSGIPLVMNGSWMEQHPLGRTEWIKFIGAFFEKDKEATTNFKIVERAYVKAAQKALEHKFKPTILSGSMFKDIWYVPGGDGYFAKILQDAGTSYLWETDNGTRSLALSYESVLDKAQDADIWIGAGNFKSLVALTDQNDKYRQFKAVQQKNVFTYSKKIGATGGLLYYELGAMRPDLVLKDIMRIAHPEITLDHELFFFQKLR